MLLLGQEMSRILKCELLEKEIYLKSQSLRYLCVVSRKEAMEVTPSFGITSITFKLL